MLTKEKNKIIKLIGKCFQENQESHQTLIAQLDLILREFDTLEKISFLKNAEFLVDRRGTKKYSHLIKQLLGIGDIPQYLKQYLDEVVIINKLFRETNHLQAKINKISPRKRLSSMLVATQQMQSAAKKVGNPQYYDKIIGWINDGVKSLIYDDQIFNGEEFIYGAKDYYTIGLFDDSLDIANQYVRDSIESAGFEDEYDEWKAGYRSFEIQNKKILSKATNKEIEFFYKTSIKECVIDHLFTIYYLVGRGILDFKRMGSPEERYNYNKFLLERKYFCKCLDVKIKNIPISEWMNAYFALKKYIKGRKYQYKYERVSFFNYGVRNKHSKTKNEWKEILIKYGVSKGYVDSIFETMIFDKKSVDLFDNPFVPCCGKYFVVPWLVDEMEVGRVLLSKFSNKSGADFKGYAFEKYIIDVLKYCGIPATAMKNKEYQCDVAFLLNDVLFICECKNRGVHKGNDLSFNEMDDDIEQLDRIANFYKENSNIVKRCFQNAGYHKISFNEVQKLIIYSKVTHGSVKRKGVFIMDIYKFLQPLGRDEMTDYLAKKYPSINESLTGEITAQKIINYYSYPIYYPDYVSTLEWVTFDYKVGKYKIKSERVKSGDWTESIDEKFIFKYCLMKKAKILHIEEMYKRGKLLEQFIPPEIRKG